MLASVLGARMSVYICRGPAMREVRRESEGERWCFRCHKRREFLFVVTAPVEPSYYGPNAVVKCSVCDLIDGDLFPGRCREWIG